jgi:hypothetical protein
MKRKTHMHRIITRLARLRSERAFTLIEVMVAGLVLVVGFIFIAQFFTSAAARILTSDTRSLMQHVATQEIETIRALQYQDVGTVGGNPAGALSSYGEAPDHHLKVVEERSFLIAREVTYVTDSSYSPGGPYPANYRRATVKVYLYTGFESDPVVTFGGVDFHVSSVAKEVEMSTIVAGGALGGTLDITVTDLAGHGVPDAQLTITDDVLVPHILINDAAIRTDAFGKIMVPGLIPDTGGGYQVRAELSGYNPAELEQTVVVVKGLPFTVVQLIIDRWATMNIHVTDQNGVPLPDVALSVTGYQSVSPWTFSQTVTTDASGTAVLPNIRYSTSLQPYFIELVTPQSPPLRLPTGVSAPTIDATLLPLPAGKIPVLLNPGQTQDVTVVVSSGPGVTAVSPAGGMLAGGNSVTITGTNFTGATAVKFGTTDAAAFTVVSATQIAATAPAHSEGTVDVTVTTPSDTSPAVSADQYTYQNPTPTVTEVSPPGGTLAGGTSVTISGTNFTGATAVKFGTTAATVFTVVSATQITATTPASSTGTVDVTITTPFGTSPTSMDDQYTYRRPAPTVTAVSPSRGPSRTIVVITGTCFTEATVVKFGGTSTTNFTVDSDTRITVTAPRHWDGTVDITVTTPSGTSANTSADDYYYYW